LKNRLVLMLYYSLGANVILLFSSLSSHRCVKAAFSPKTATMRSTRNSFKLYVSVLILNNVVFLF
jgi:cytochrome c biogenesis protein CcdA